MRAASLWLLAVLGIVGCEKAARTRDAAGPAPMPDAAPRVREGDVAVCAPAEAAVVTAIAEEWRTCALRRASTIDALIAKKASASARDEAARASCPRSAHAVTLRLGEDDFLWSFGRDRKPGEQATRRVARDRGTAACLPGALARLADAAKTVGADASDANVKALLAAEGALDRCVPPSTDMAAMVGLLSGIGGSGPADPSEPPPAGPFEADCTSTWQNDPTASLFDALGGSGTGTIGLGTIGTLGHGGGGGGTGTGITRGSRRGRPATPPPPPSPPPPPPPPELELVSGTTPSNQKTIERRVRWAFCRRARQLRCCAHANGVGADTPAILRVDVAADGTLAAVAGEGPAAKFASCATEVLGGMSLAKPDQGAIALRYRTSIPDGIWIDSSAP